MEIVLVLALAGLGYYGYKHYVSAAKVAAIKAEIANIEAHVKADYAIVKPELSAAEEKAKATVLAIVAALKAKL
jgi:uncharacterized membrane protein YebE (DUF533 family)